MEKATLEGALCSVLLTKHYSGDQIKKNEMRLAGHVTRVGEGKVCVEGFGGET
jgi:hypothetical protein